MQKVQNLSFKNPSKVVEYPAQASEQKIKRLPKFQKKYSYTQNQISSERAKFPSRAKKNSINKSTFIKRKNQGLNQLKNKSVLFGLRPQNERFFRPKKAVTTNNSKSRYKPVEDLEREQTQKVNFKAKKTVADKKDHIKTMKYQNKQVKLKDFKRCMKRMLISHKGLENVVFNNNVIIGNLMTVISDIFPNKRKSVLTLNLKNNQFLTMKKIDFKNLFEYCQSKNINLIY